MFKLQTGQRRAIWSSLLAMVLYMLAGYALSGLIKIAFPWGYVIRFILFGLFTYFLVRRFAASGGLSLTDLRVSRFPRAFYGVLWALALPAAFFFLTAYGAGAGQWHMNRDETGELAGRVIQAVFFSGICSGITEEMLFRGYMLGRAEKEWKLGKAIWLPTACFALGHFPFSADLGSSLQRILLLGCLGVLFASVTVLDGSIWESALLHASWDLFVSGSSIVSVGRNPDPAAVFTYVVEADPYIMGLTDMERGILTVCILLLCDAGMVVLLKHKKKWNC